MFFICEFSSSDWLASVLDEDTLDNNSYQDDRDKERVGKETTEYVVLEGS
jgi:hypothetical protein